MKKLLGIVVLSLLLSGSAYANKEKANSHGGANELPESARPNDATISLFEVRKKNFIDRRRSQGRLYTVPPKGNAKKFTYEKNISSSKVDKQLSKGFLLSYLFYDNGVIKYDGMAKKGRFRDDVTDKTLFYTHSTGKSITSYIVGHAICDGYISSIDEIIDWPLMENTLYHGQPLRNLLNMAAGDKHVVDEKTTRFKGSFVHHRDIGLDTIALLLQGTKPKGNKVFYNNALADIIANYIVFKSGKDYDKLMKKVFQDKIKIANEIAYEKHGQPMNKSQTIPQYHGSPQTLASYSYYMTRLDFLRFAEAMMRDYQNKTCVGNYLRESQQQAKKWFKYRPTKKNAQWYLHNYSKKYGSQFYFDFQGLKKRNIIGTEGYNGQNILIDLDNSRIVVTNSAATGWNVKTYMLNVIRKGELPK
ncbi:serine hydrolase [Candidatus Pelagibacter sp.]|nr:serine hydrolase [Candidatus Pelagibacter sp.]